MDIQDIARVVHNVNRAYCASIGDDSQAPWDDAPKWQQDSAINGVIYRINNPDTTSADMHQNWWNEKIADGWVYGEVKDPEAKTHPCCVPYDQLPENQRVKDTIFSAIVDEFAPKRRTFVIDTEQGLIDHVNRLERRLTVEEMVRLHMIRAEPGTISAEEIEELLNTN